MTRQSQEGYLPEQSTNLDHLPHIKGYDFEGDFDLKRFIDAYATTGMQASELSRSIHTVKAMWREKADVYLAATSNMVTSGVREAICYLAKHKKIAAFITTAGGIEEDVIKTLRPFVLGDFAADGRYLFQNGINRSGNIFVTNDRYAAFEQFMQPFFASIKGKRLSMHELVKELGLFVEDESSILHWCARNDIPVFCPAPTDGSIGDLFYWQRQRDPEFRVDVVGDMQAIVKMALHAEKTAVVALGGGPSKHFALNAQIFREGCDYALYINTGTAMDGSDSGAAPDEAVSWGKISVKGLSTKVFGDATILFPLVLVGALNT